MRTLIVSVVFGTLRRVRGLLHPAWRTPWLVWTNPTELRGHVIAYDWIPTDAPNLRATDDLLRDAATPWITRSKRVSQAMSARLATPCCFLVGGQMEEARA